MSIGVATTNGNLLITFANEYMEKEVVDPITAAIEAGTTRLWPILIDRAGHDSWNVADVTRARRR